MLAVDPFWCVGHCDEFLNIRSLKTNMFRSIAFMLIFNIIASLWHPTVMSSAHIGILNYRWKGGVGGYRSGTICIVPDTDRNSPIMALTFDVTSCLKFRVLNTSGETSDMCSGVQVSFGKLR